MTHILLVDDDNELRELLTDILTLEGFTIYQACNGEEGLEAVAAADANNTPLDLILLDVMMPKMNGTDMLKQLRTQWQTPVLMLTAKGEEIDRVIGLEFGADDYLAKPFSDRELLARIRAILRRTQNQPITQVKEDSNAPHGIQVFPGKQEAYFNDELMDLTSTEFALLAYFLQHLGESISKDDLSMEVLGKRLSPFDRAIDMHVSNLRKKLQAQDEEKTLIKTLRGRGYLMVEAE